MLDDKGNRESSHYVTVLDDEGSCESSHDITVLDDKSDDPTAFISCSCRDCISCRSREWLRVCCASSFVSLISLN